MRSTQRALTPMHTGGTEILLSRNFRLSVKKSTAISPLMKQLAGYVAAAPRKALHYGSVTPRVTLIGGASHGDRHFQP